MTTAEAAHEYSAVNTLLVVVVLGFCVLAAYAIKRNSFYYLPESAAAIIVGIVVGGLAKSVYRDEEVTFLTFESEIFFFLLLPPIIFEAGYSLQKKDFVDNFWSIALYAIFGTIISTFIVGYLVYLMGIFHVMEIDISSPMEALVFGSLISAVDPVATLSIMGNPELNCDALLYSLVFGESMLNDAVAIVLFKTFLIFHESGEAFTLHAVGSLLINFTYICFGSFLIGICFGLSCSYLCKHTALQTYPEYEISILFLFAYGSYSFAESVALSGIMSLFFCGMTLSQYNIHNLSPTSQITAHTIFKSLAILCEYVVFLAMGMQLFTKEFAMHLHLQFFWCAFLFCVIGRFFNIFPLTYIANLTRTEQISLPLQMVMWFSGLRGAIAFALAQGMPKEHRGIYVSTTLLLVIFTTIVLGGLTEPMLTFTEMRLPGSSLTNSIKGSSSKDNIRKAHSKDAFVLSSSLSRINSEEHPFLHNRISARHPVERSLIVEALTEGDEDDDEIIFREDLTLSKKKTMLERLDDEYMKPMFGGPTVDEFAYDEAGIASLRGVSSDR